MSEPDTNDQDDFDFYGEAGKHVNGLIELGQEMFRILFCLTPNQRFDLLPDWFAPRLLKLVPLPADISDQDVAWILAEDAKEAVRE